MMSRKCSGLKPAPARFGSRAGVSMIGSPVACGGGECAHVLAHPTVSDGLLRPNYDFAVSEPLPRGVGICAQVPLATYFQALPWKSTVEVPAQVVPGPAAQSLSPLSATP